MQRIKHKKEFLLQEVRDLYRTYEDKRKALGLTEEQIFFSRELMQISTLLPEMQRLGISLEEIKSEAKDAT